MASHAARLHSLRFQSHCHTRPQATDVFGIYCHITLATAVPPTGEGRAPAAGTNLAPPGDRQAPAVDDGPFLSRTQGSSAPPGECRAPAAGTNHAPPGDRQATAVDEGRFCPELTRRWFKHRYHALGSFAAVATSDHTVIMSCLQGCRITLCLALRSVQTGVLIEILLDFSAIVLAIPRCGPEEISYVEARCPHPAPVVTFAHLGRDSVLARQFQI